jgi:hypothetical protein
MLVACALGFLGCRFGTAQPESFAEPTARDAALEDEGGSGSRAAAEGGRRTDPAPQSQAPTAGTVAVPAGAGSGGPRMNTAGSMSRPTPQPGPSADFGEDAGSPSEPNAGSCGSIAEIAGCNPITNTGCAGELGMQCDVDLLASTLSGVCVFSATSPNPECLAIPPTETCPPQQTCVEGVCQTICLCDSDCGLGACCRDPLGELGFKMCATC